MDLRKLRSIHRWIFAAIVLSLLWFIAATSGGGLMLFAFFPIFLIIPATVLLFLELVSAAYLREDGANWLKVLYYLLFAGYLLSALLLVYVVVAAI